MIYFGFINFLGPEMLVLAFAFLLIAPVVIFAIKLLTVLTQILKELQQKRIEKE